MTIHIHSDHRSSVNAHLQFCRFQQFYTLRVIKHPNQHTIENIEHECENFLDTFTASTFECCMSESLSSLEVCRWSDPWLESFDAPHARHHARRPSFVTGRYQTSKARTASVNMQQLSADPYRTHHKQTTNQANSPLQNLAPSANAWSKDEYSQVITKIGQLWRVCRVMRTIIKFL